LGYTYDAGGHLAEVRQNGALLTTYTYDANGNRTARNAEAATYDAQDRVLTHGAASFAWTRNGDLRSRSAGGQTTVYTYDLRGDLASVALPTGSQIEYLLDPLGHRIGRKLNGTLQRGWLWEGGRIAAEVDGSSVATSRFVYAVDGTAPSFMIKGIQTYRIISDERGSVRLVVDTTDGTVAQQLDYDEFGRVLADTAPGFQPFGYAGGLYDPDTGLTRFGARDYSAESGQWLDRDPIGFAGGQFSLYAYVGNDPVNAIDPTGAGPYTLQFGPSGSIATPLGGFTFGFGVAVDTRGNTVATLSFGTGVSAGVGASAGQSIGVTKDGVSAIPGRGGQIGASGGDFSGAGVGGDVQLDSNLQPNGVSLNAGVSVKDSTAGEAHAYVTQAYTAPISRFEAVQALNLFALPVIVENAVVAHALGWR
jgi:RHS repeat-associated protein